MFLLYLTKNWREVNTIGEKSNYIPCLNIHTYVHIYVCVFACICVWLCDHLGGNSGYVPM